MSDDEQDARAQPEERPVHSDERSIELSEHGQKGIDVRPTSDPQAVNLPPMSGPAPIETAPGDQGGADASGTGRGERSPQDSGGSDSAE